MFDSAACMDIFRWYVNKKYLMSVQKNTCIGRCGQGQLARSCGRVGARCGRAMTPALLFTVFDKYGSAKVRQDLKKIRHRHVTQVEPCDLTIMCLSCNRAGVKIPPGEVPRSLEKKLRRPVNDLGKSTSSLLTAAMPMLYMDFMDIDI